jgi:glycosyltransferase involved in cell wall biosynthesis
MKILFSPCQYLYDELKYGGELGLTFNVGDRLASKNEGSVVVTGKAFTGGSKNYQIIELQKEKTGRDTSVRNAIKFNWQYYRATHRILRHRDFDVLHHVLPFALDTTFNLEILFSRGRRKVPAVIGPIPSPLLHRDSDSDSSNKMLPQQSGLDVGHLVITMARIILKTMSAMTLRRASKVVVMNETCKRLVLARGVQDSKIAVIPPGIDSHKFPYTPYEQKDNKVTEILVVCVLLRRKRVDKIVRAMSQVVRKNQKVRLTIVGDGPQREILEELVKQQGLTRYVNFTGYIPNSEVPQYFRTGHIFINMSESEGFSIVFLEAMASGLAIISSKVGGYSDAIVNGSNGFLLDTPDEDHLADKILELADEPARIGAVGLRARKTIESEYDWERAIIPKYLGIYKALVNESNTWRAS